MRVKNKYGFINERGSYNFDFNDENESKTFMVSCIVVNENQLEQLNTESSFIVKDFLKADNLIDEDLKWTMKKVALKDLSHLDIEIFIFEAKEDTKFLKFLACIFFKIKSSLKLKPIFCFSQTFFISKKVCTFAPNH